MANLGRLIVAKTGEITALREGDTLVFRIHEPHSSTFWVMQRGVDNNLVFSDRRDTEEYINDKLFLTNISTLDQVTDVAEVVAAVSGLFCGPPLVNENSIHFRLYSSYAEAHPKR